MNALVEQDIRGVVQVAHEAGAIVKVILETSLLSVEEKLRASELALERGHRFPQDQHRILYRRSHGGRCGDPAWRCGKSLRSEGFRRNSHLHDARAMLEAGATRIGASASVAILREFEAAHE